MQQIFELYGFQQGFEDGTDAVVNWLLENGGPLFSAIRWPVAQLLTVAESFMLFLPWPLVIIAVLALGWWRAGWGVGAVGGIGLLLLGFLGYWDLSMTTVSMIVTAVAFCIVLGIPLGILAARSDRFDQTLRPILDAMQTIHPFVYLVPIVMFFGIGKVPGTLATIVFALPPIVRLTNLGIRQVSREVVEAGRAFGSDEMQLLLEIQLPLALPTIMAGLNQTLMLSLSMVVIVALIAGGGLGQEIVRGVNRLDVGHAASSGLAVLILAIILDRISQAQSGAS